ncbi:YceI family protein [Flammeovirgaceae bacterium SG7u.111]|nr:YceI family protein [Flammeovirgaceae bacterium SG7u.132]WPO36765.1 YceI family protein [Flammeovirgaceae bacterium SG7u.111]
MKKVIIAALSVLMLSAFITNAPVKYSVDAASSTLTWKASKVTGSHTGNVSVSEGNLDYADGELKGGEFTIDMTSITCTDIEDAETNGKLIGHLKSADFFSVADNATSTFKITKVEKIKKNEFKVTGNLTIKGITNSLSFPATVKEKNGNVEAAATIKVDRTKYDIKYGSGSFFDGLGDKMIYDEFELDLKLVAKSS